uniref:DNA directed RNA polymerase, 7 kDa subunit/PUB domain containing protein, putative n=1 Tax=Theileria annulata TaxID=5874 RepID=A0A3B0MU25_THEAN
MESGFNDTEDLIEPITYICGECGHDVALQPTSAVRCRNCGSRILYKKRSYRELKALAEVLYSTPESKLLDVYSKFEHFKTKLNSLLSSIARYRIQLQASEDNAIFGPKTLKIVQSVVSDYDKLYEIYQENLFEVFSPLEHIWNEGLNGSKDESDNTEKDDVKSINQETKSQLNQIEEYKKKLKDNIKEFEQVDFERIRNEETELSGLLNKVLKVYREDPCDNLETILCDICEAHPDEFLKIVENVANLVKEISRRPDELSLRVLRLNNEKLREDFLSHHNSVKLLKFAGFKIATTSDIQQTLSNCIKTNILLVNMKFDEEYFLYLHEPDMFTIYTKWRAWLDNLNYISDSLTNFYSTMSKKNSKTAVKKRINIIKTEFMINNKKKELRRELKKLQNHVKSQFLKLSINSDTDNVKDGIPEIDISKSKPKNRGTNFSRSFDSSRPLRARDKKIIQASLKRKRKLTMQLN